MIVIGSPKIVFYFKNIFQFQLSTFCVLNNVEYTKNSFFLEENYII